MSEEFGRWYAIACETCGKTIRFPVVRDDDGCLITDAKRYSFVHAEEMQHRVEVEELAPWHRAGVGPTGYRLPDDPSVA